MKVYAFNKDDPAAKFVFGSIASAAGEMQKKGLKISKDMVKHRVHSGGEAFGWIFMDEIVHAKYMADNNNNAQVEETIDITPPQQHNQPVGLFGDEFDEEFNAIFRGKRLRMTPDNKFSVYDYVSIINETDNPRKVISAVRLTQPEVVTKMDNFSFQGQGSRPTPVCDVEVLTELTMVLPGKNAQAFRAKGAKIIVKKLSELRDEYASKGLKASPVMEICHNHTTQPDISNQVSITSSNNKYHIMSPDMNGKRFDEFAGRELVYLLLIRITQLEIMLKFGKTTDMLKRFDDHCRDFKDYDISIWYLCPTMHSDKVEQQFKNIMKMRGHLCFRTINGKNHTELLENITPEEATYVLKSIVEEHFTDTDSAFGIKIMTILSKSKDSDNRVREKELDKELVKERNNHEYNMKMLQMEKTKAILELIKDKDIPVTFENLLQLYN